MIMSSIVDKEEVLQKPESEEPEPEESVPVEAADRSEASLPPPNGGWKAWLQVFGAHLLFFNSW
jgi:hypothetical protein